MKKNDPKISPWLNHYYMSAIARITALLRAVWYLSLTGDLKYSSFGSKYKKYFRTLIAEIEPTNVINFGILFDSVNNELLQRGEISYDEVCNNEGLINDICKKLATKTLDDYQIDNIFGSSNFKNLKLLIEDGMSYDDVISMLYDIELALDIDVKFKYHSKEEFKAERIKACQDAFSAWKNRSILHTPSLVSSVKTINQEYIAWLKKHPDQLPNISWEAFEKLIAEIFSSYGFQVDIIAKQRGMSGDIIAIKTDEVGVTRKYLIECKCYNDTRHIGIAIVNEVIGAAMRAKTDYAMLVTTSSFTKNVFDRTNEIKSVRLELREGREIKDWLLSYKQKDDGELWLPVGWDI
ncbi:hypothetical protein GMLC_08020 [Geomonas limicola]|uniref:Restriction endonuclease type IV Mrr domain-containing protein n=1 Tax=Geomonas limicola TaxID=2740186 RepID=A0A6V8N6P1_9BACT|nr:restriction endonuclease [Geomonas limicola]GFO67223.1 hypothetical protein GMLC_08020 [Geomonas limicola]